MTDVTLLDRENMHFLLNGQLPTVPSSVAGPGTKTLSKANSNLVASMVKTFLRNDRADIKVPQLDRTA